MHDEKSVLNDARAAGGDSPMLFGYLSRLHHEELRQAIASQIAAQETLDSHGTVATPEAIEARKAVETHLQQNSLNDLDSDEVASKLKSPKSPVFGMQFPSPGGRKIRCRVGSFRGGG